MAKFKVGDLVRIVVTYRIHSLRGKEAIITEVLPYGYGDFQEQCYRDDIAPGFCLEHQFEPFTDKGAEDFMRMIKSLPALEDIRERAVAKTLSNI